MKYLSLFSGIGGFELGIQQAYERLHNLRPDELANCERPKELHNTKNQLLEWECVGYSEIDKYAISIYQSHFPEHHNYGDITKINENELPDFDLLVGGFPCQAFSIAGKRKGFEDTRGTMFFEIARILRTKQPRLFCLENVKGLLSHDNGNTFSTIISTLDELGYDLQWQVLNSKNHGVPQNRERIFIIGHLRGTSRPEVFPFGEGNQQTNLKPEVLGNTNNSGRGERSVVYGENGIMTTLTATDYKQPKQILQNAKIRRLTPTECERLQGFPDGWTKYGGHKKASDIISKNPEHGDAFEIISDTQRYKTLGNAVTVNVIRDIMEKLLLTND